MDTADNAWKAVTAAMTEPLFLEFADEVLKVIEPDPESEPHLEWNSEAAGCTINYNIYLLSLQIDPQISFNDFYSNLRTFNKF